MKLRLATWNVNSVRQRLPLVARFVREQQPDIICLQETKVVDDLFPLSDLQSLGFPHIAFSGQKSYNGVAILSKLPFEKVETFSICDSAHKRHISAILPEGIALHNFYVPAGGDIPDREQNPAFGFKLDFCMWMDDYFRKGKAAHRKAILVGDLNIAPLPDDVWSHKQLLNVVSHTPVETELLTKLQHSLNWVDTARHFTPTPQKLYSWWSYRNRDWRASDRGRRLDHIWVTPDLQNALKTCQTLMDARDWETPSDHVPVMCELAL